MWWNDSPRGGIGPGSVGRPPAEHRELRFHVTARDGDPDAASAHHIDHGQILGQPQRIVKRGRDGGPMNASGLYTLVLPVATSPSSSIAMLVR